MRISLMHLKNRVRAPQNEKKVPFKEILPMKLKDRVSGKMSLGREEGCLYELSSLMSCFKENNFENKMCGPEIEKFRTCICKFQQNKDVQRQLQKKEIPTPNAKNYTHKQIGYLLRMHSNI